VIERLCAHYGFSRSPFGRNLAPSMLHQHHGHAEAVARITWLIGEHAIGVVTGEVGAGKTVAARAAVHALDPVRHTVIYLANPLVGQRGLYAEIVRHLGGTPRFHCDDPGGGRGEGLTLDSAGCVPVSGPVDPSRGHRLCVVAAVAGA
jgi:type II secretory pathway predicted ATPase ExeA